MDEQQIQEILEQAIQYSLTLSETLGISMELQASLAGASNGRMSQELAVAHYLFPNLEQDERCNLAKLLAGRRTIETFLNVDLASLTAPSKKEHECLLRTLEERYVVTKDSILSSGVLDKLTEKQKAIFDSAFMKVNFPEN